MKLLDSLNNELGQLKQKQKNIENEIEYFTSTHNNIKKLLDEQKYEEIKKQCDFLIKYMKFKNNPELGKKYTEKLKKSLKH